MLVAVTRQKPWDRERTTAQPTSGSGRDEKKTNTSNSLRASTIVRDKKRALVVLEKKNISGSYFIGLNFRQNYATETCISLQLVVLRRQGWGNGTCMMFVLFCCALQLTFVL